MLGIAAALSLPAAAAALQFADWGTAQKIDETAGNSTELNTPSLDGCPIQAPGPEGSSDVYVTTR